MAVINKNGTYMALPSAIKRGGATALDTTSVWYDRALMEFYAQGGGKLGEVDVPITAYVGQILTLVDETNNTATAYLIVDEAGHLNEVGSATLGDNASIELVDGVLSVKDFGKQYYKYVAAVEGGEAAHYELTEGWAAGLEPRVVEVEGEMVIGWYEPNPTTAEGVKDQVIEVQGEVEQVQNDVKDLEDLLNGTEDAPGLIEEVDNIAEALYGTEGENPVPGLIDQVEAIDSEVEAVAKNLADNYYKKSETYNKTEVDGLVSGVFHFEGTAESYEALPTENNIKGDVYQVNDVEYAWNGETWVKLGYTIDLSSYYIKSEVDTAIENAQKATEELVTENADAIDGLTERVEALEGEDTTINGRIDGAIERVEALETAVEHFEVVDGKIEALETAKAGFDDKFEVVDGKIAALEKADEGFETRIGSLEDNVGSPSEGFTSALFPAVEALQERIDGLTAQGGEPNLLNGVSIGGVKLTPDAQTKIVDMPIFAGSAAGLVPVVNGLDNTYYLNAAGEWTVPMDSRIGELGDFDTVVDYVDNAISAAMSWSTIA